jgi:hypothetical protein
LDTHKNADKRKVDLLIDRLAHLSADSIWAHRASGIRGAILRLWLQSEQEGTIESSLELEQLLNQGYWILEAAAKEIPDSSQTKT